MEITIKSNEEKMYKEILILFASCIKNLGNLRPREISLLAEIMYQNHKYSNMEEDEKWILIWSTKNRKRMQNKLNMNEDVFNTNKSILRKYGALTKEDKLLTGLQINPDNGFTITFNFIKE